ncbi:hypothetical protein SAMN04487965_2509 [Microbulbifer donghaiensis]|uniref:Peptidase propeptide and YPEB domain-containing protein n=1 Tax=Microbulbifer donghaiensis TaxID=494016 RepID=A0A1M5DVG5_9GAMM|nr:hypothetical protein [Microbulbifer donghaiensis]SHF70854.1 hypothetical protein SAMN04487965_2509 [Microbulbifer donghaiensis]
MKKLILTFIVLISVNTESFDTPIWSNKSKEQDRLVEEKVLLTAKKWASKIYSGQNEIREYEYRVTEESTRTHVMITPVYNDGSVLVDGDMCLLVSNEGELIEAKQCIAP